MQLTDEHLAIIISWAKKTQEVEAVFVSGNPPGIASAKGDIDLALSLIGQDPLWQLATFISRRRSWRAELETALGLAVQLERARRNHPPESDLVELWRRA
jgi:hypothetical protein